MNHLAAYRNRWVCDGDVEAALYLVGTNHEGEEKRQHDLMLWAGLKPSHKFLDLGCGVLRGTIRLIAYLEEGNFYGADVSQSLIRLAHERLVEKDIRTKVDLRTIDTFDLSSIYEETKFDRLLAVSVLTHLLPEDVRPFFKGISEVLTDDGLAIISCLPLAEDAHSDFAGDVNTAHYKVKCLLREAHEAGLDLREVPGDYANPAENFQMQERVNTPYLGQWVLSGRRG